MSSSVFKAQYILANVRVRFLMSNRGQPLCSSPLQPQRMTSPFFPMQSV